MAERKRASKTKASGSATKKASRKPSAANAANAQAPASSSSSTTEIKPGRAGGQGAPLPGAGLGEITDHDLWLFNEGNHLALQDKLGAHVATVNGKQGVRFAVWAPNAEHVSVIGDFNHWQKPGIELRPMGHSGVWSGFIEGIGKGAVYKFFVRSHHNGYQVEKADPFALTSEVPPKTASIVWDLEYEWGDREWMERRAQRDALHEPMSIYEVHLGSWMRKGEHGQEFLNYRELAHKLADYCEKTGFTHIEFLPVMEHPFYGSWGYQATGFFAPTSRYGSPQDFMYLVDHLHQRGIGVILDWSPSHFPNDQHALSYFDGTHLYEHADPKQRIHPDWKSDIFNLGRNEVQAFLLSSAMCWLHRYHIDGLRVDAVASMLYLDYSRKEGEWTPNEHGGRENLDSIRFLRRLNETVYGRAPGAVTIAEESTAWPMVSRPTYIGGLGFGFKWDMGWMHDTLKYMEHQPIHRRYHHDQITFRMIYAFNENFVMPLSHDEVVHGKGSLLDKMPGDDWQKFASLRLLFAYQWAQPGKKLLFQGSEIAARGDWSHDRSLDWHLLEHESHRGVQTLVSDLNRLYSAEPALHSLDCDPAGFEWIDGADVNQSVLVFMRKSRLQGEEIVIACNFTPVPRENYRVGVPGGGAWREIFNSDAREYWGSGVGNMGRVEAREDPWHGRSHSIVVTLPPLACVMFRRETQGKTGGTS